MKRPRVIDKLLLIYGIFTVLVLLLYMHNMDKIKTSSYSVIFAAALFWPIFVVFVPIILFEEWIRKLDK